MKDGRSVAELRGYSVLTVRDAKRIATSWIEAADLKRAVAFGLPEVDDRYHVWRVPLLGDGGHGASIGEVVIDARTSLILQDKSTSREALEARLLKRTLPRRSRNTAARRENGARYELSALRNVVALGDSEQILYELPAESVNLAFTSPPYYNARVEYSEYLTYEDYLEKIRRVIRAVHRVLSEGRFFVMNVSPILVRRKSRSESSRRIAMPFDMHRLFLEEGFDFIDDIIWEKPEGAGWVAGRGRRFAADRNPLQYKPVVVTEYLLVYRKHTDKLIDWSIRAHPRRELVRSSSIQDGYERTNVWRLKPAHDRRHPAIFPVELAERVITYYSFKEDVVLDPFAGIGTVGKAAVRLGRRFVLVEKEPQFVKVICEEATNWLGKEAENILTVGCPPIVPKTLV